MPSFIKNLTFDCEDALPVARFWAAALVSDVDEESTAERANVEAPGWVARTSGSEVVAGQRWRPTECTLTSARLLRAKERGGDREGRGRVAQRPSRLVEAGQRDHPPGDGVA
jgi:hypothetical protein